MNKLSEPTIEDLLAELVAEIRNDVPHLDTLPPMTLSIALLKATRDPANSVARFQARVLADESFGHLRAGWLGSTGEGMGIQDHMLTLSLIHACLDGKEPTFVIDSARTFARTKKSELRTYYAIAGVTVTEAIRLAPNLRLIPWTEVPHSATSRRLAPRHGVAARYYPTEEIVPMRADPECALEVDAGVSLTLLPGYLPETQQEYLEHFSRMQQRAELAEDVVRCMFLLVIKPMGILAEWPFAAEPAAELLFGGRLSYRQSLFELAHSNPGESVVNGNDLTTLWKEYSALSAADKEVLRHAIDRLSLATRRPNFVDRAIDLGIALEMLLLHNLPESGELTLRLCLRGTNFLGGTHEQRVSTYTTLKASYDIRSKAVHEGRFKKKKILERAPETIQNGISVASAISRKLIMSGKFPKNWEAEYLLGSGPAN